MSNSWKLIIITGASRGFGRSVAKAFARKVSASSNIHLVLSARSREDLEQTRLLILNEIEATNAVDITLLTSDLADVDKMGESAAQLFDISNFPSRKYEETIFINNAGSLGLLAPIGSSSMSSSACISAFNLNITSACYLTSEFVRR